METVDPPAGPRKRSGGAHFGAERSLKSRRGFVEKGYKPVTVLLSPKALESLRIAQNIHGMSQREAIDKALIQAFRE